MTGASRTPLSSDTLIAADWPAPPNVRALVTTRRMPGNSLPPYDAMNLGLRSGEDEAVVRANRALLARALELPSAPRFLRQVHGIEVARFDRAVPSGEHLPSRTRAPAEDDECASGTADALPEIEADAAVTQQPGIVLAILTADCLPVLLCAEDGSEIGAAHAGWRGPSAGVIDACVGRMHTPPPRLLAWLGPAIGRPSYEVGDEVRAAFVSRDAGAAAAFAPTRPGHWLCDLYTLARRRLAALGVRGVSGGGFDTAADARFYSYRRDGAHSGRFATLVWRDR